jgi:hypothetical protein
LEQEQDDAEFGDMFQRVDIAAETVRAETMSSMMAMMMMMMMVTMVRWHVRRL